MPNLLLVNPIQSFNEGKAIGDNNRFNELAGQAIQDPNNASSSLGLAATINPGKALQIQDGLQSTQDARQKKLAGAANYVLSAYKTGNPQQVEGAYQAVRPFLNQLGKELGQGEASPTFTPEMLPHLYQIVGEAGGDTAINGQLPTGLREIQGQIAAAGLTGDDAKKAYRIALGIEPRAVTGAAKTGMITGADGRERPFTFDPSTQSYKVFDGQQFRPLDQSEAAQLSVGTGQAPVSAQTPTAVTPEALMQQATQMANQGGPGANAAQAEAWLQQQLDAQGRLPTPASGTGALGVSRAPEETAGAVQNAKNASDLAFLPKTEGIKADVAVDETARKAAAEANIKSGVDRNALARSNATALTVWSTAMRNLESSLDNTNTGPISGRLPAVTANQQIAEGAVAQMAPVLKQLFRTAGEGTFTDKDQDLLLKMLPDRADHPAAREAKIKAIDALVKAKLQTQPVTPVSAAPGQAVASSQHPIPQTQADFDALPSGSLYVDPDDGQTYRKP